MLPVEQLLIAFVLLTTVKLEGTFLTTDYLENGYVITAKNELQKMDSSGTVLFTYNQNRYGKLQFADATNPLKLVLSYPDFGTVVMLDNTLSEIGVIPLRTLNILSYSAVCFSSLDNNIWVFDDQDYKLKKIDQNNNIIVESSDMFSLTGKAIRPVYMQERDQYVYLGDPDEGIIVFDVYGTYYHTIPITGITAFQVRNDQLFFRHGSSFHTYHLKTLEEKEIPLPADNALDVRIEKNRLYVLGKDQMEIFTY